LNRKSNVYLLESIRVVGKVTRSIKANAKIKDERKSKRKHNHSIAAALYKLGRDKLSTKWPVELMNCLSLSKHLIIFEPVIDSAKCCITGALQTPVNLCNSLAASM
jgi:hypothetical protein